MVLVEFPRSSEASNAARYLWLSSGRLLLTYNGVSNVVSASKVPRKFSFSTCCFEHVIDYIFTECNVIVVVFLLRTRVVLQRIESISDLSYAKVRMYVSLRIYLTAIHFLTQLSILIKCSSPALLIKCINLKKA